MEILLDLSGALKEALGGPFLMLSLSPSELSKILPGHVTAPLKTLSSLQYNSWAGQMAQVKTWLFPVLV